ncbi:MAG: YaaL family protein [Firmicutes bacterium]|nr:YaaL family protein [Bacillota bacterium]
MARLIDQLNVDWRERAARIPKEKQFGLIEEAKRDWQAARDYFNAVTDPELIDHAIYTMEAAEKRYVYLLRRAREDGLFQEKFLPDFFNGAR